MKEIRVFVVDDHPMVIEGLKTMLSDQPGIELAGYAMTAASCRGFFMNHSADVALLDINLPDQSGIDLCAELKKEFPAIKILGISNFEQGSFIERMMEKGASGYVLKNASRAELVNAIQTVYAGKKYFSPQADHQLKQEVHRKEHAPILTTREKEVLKFIAEGFTNPQIAEKLFVSPSTIDSHRKNLLSKLEAFNTASMLKAATEHGFL
jgi:DNA-binding NarL/FixJ family response regulator